jgi:hypothetical protein
LTLDRLEAIGNLIMFCAALFGVVQRDTVGSGLIGLALSYAIGITSVCHVSPPEMLSHSC